MTEPRERTGYELRFQPLTDAERPRAFPCDRHGRVDLDRLGRVALFDYLYARASVGRVFRRPTVGGAAHPA